MTAKKVARYVRGPNGVYRRCEDDRAAKAGEETVDDLINELQEASYYVEDPNISKATAHNTSTALDGSNADTPTSSTFDSASEASVDISTGHNILENLVPEPQMINSLVSHVRSWLGKFPTDYMVQILIPFGLGMVSMLVLQAMQPLLIYFGGILAHYLKVLLTWGMIGAGLVWYADFLKFRLFGLWNQVFRLKSDVSGQKDTSGEHLVDDHVAEMGKETTDSLLVNADKVADTATSPTTLEPPPETDALSRLHRVSVRPFISPMRLEPPIRSVDRPHLARISTDRETKKVRLRMSPVRPSRESRRHLSASLHGHDLAHEHDLLYRDHSHENYMRELYRDPKEPNRDTYINVRDAYRKGSSPKLKSKPLPPVYHDVNEDLPLIHEVQLMSLDNDLLGRMDTAISKKSVLGTRSNYSKFLSNVGH